MAMPSTLPFAGVGALALVWAQAAMAQVAPAAELKRTYNIAAGTLDQVLNRFAAIAGVELSVDAALTRDKASVGLNGSYTVQEGFAQLLQGQGLNVMQGGNGAYSLRAAPVAAGAEIGRAHV